MERPTMLIQALVLELARDLDLSADRDVQVIARRCEHEGLSFLTITLPILSDSLERGLEDGRFTCPSNFRRHGRLPRFLGGFFKRVFSMDGDVLPTPDVDAIYAIRQICRFFKKLKIECSPDRNLAAIRRFKEVESELFHASAHIRDHNNPLLDAISRIIWPTVLPEPSFDDLVCRHGPGATAERLSANKRFRIKQWYSRWEPLFPPELHAFANYNFAYGAGEFSDAGLDDLEMVEVTNEPPVRVVFVPKTLTAPRVIAIEPSPMQFIQQSLMRYMVRACESHPLTRGSIRFTDQSVNQRLALEASRDGRLATLDLKDASDRVHYELVRRIFKHSGILDYLEAARSLHASLPDGSNIVLSKFASMGSAICFPVEAACFYTIVQYALHAHDGRRPSQRSVKYYSSLIDIYGDDIIVPVEYVDAVVRALECYSLRVNLNKSFRTSLFRESCGGDFYNGYAVKPAYARVLPPEDGRRWNASELMSMLALRNQVYYLGLWGTCQLVTDWLEQAMRRPLPRSRSAAAGMVASSCVFDTHRKWMPDLQKLGLKSVQFEASRRLDSIDGDGIACSFKALSQSRDRAYEEHERNPFLPLEIDKDSPSLDFESSVNRGLFKSKVRWVRSLHG